MCSGGWPDNPASRRQRASGAAGRPATQTGTLALATRAGTGLSAGAPSSRTAAGRSCDGTAPWPGTQHPAYPELSNWPGRLLPGTARPRAPAAVP
eukprot:10291820-Alexandrium_andersonii.AAC.2